MGAFLQNLLMKESMEVLISYKWLVLITCHVIGFFGKSNIWRLGQKSLLLKSLKFVEKLYVASSTCIFLLIIVLTLMPA